GPPRFALVFALLTTWTVGACGPDRTPGFEYEVEIVPLAADVFHVGDHLAIPIGLRIFGDHLVAIDQQGHHNVHVIDRDDGTLRRSVGSVGEGPTEFRAPVAVIPDAEGRLWVVDGGEQRAMRVNPDRVAEGEDWAGEIVTFSGQAVLDAVRTADGRWLVEGIFPEGRLALFDAGGKLLGFPVDLPAHDDMSPIQASQAHWSSLAAHPDLDRFVLAGHNHAEILYLDRNGEAADRADVPIPVEPEYVLGSGNRFTTTDGSLAAYADVVATRDRIYALFSGRTGEDYGAYQLLGRDVHVFDWEGELVSVLRLDRDALTLEVDEENGWLYTVELDPRPAILRYPLPPALTRGGAGSR
ncbi:MAG: BF3164 family lipoprotein, partial [Gemmatimonadota bacterium]|nr:BF3164 family lipoprotein [Gemmatimonadota bacterium]